MGGAVEIKMMQVWSMERFQLNIILLVILSGIFAKQEQM